MDETLAEIAGEFAAWLRKQPKKTQALAPETAAALAAWQPGKGSQAQASLRATIPLVEPVEAPDAAVVAEAPPADRVAALAAQADVVAACTKCLLCHSRTQTVFGVGNPHADLVFVGEAPGQEEDRRGEPFVGRAGQLLTDIITKGMKLRREDVYICNVLKCRPPGNRTPNLEEMTQCEPYLLEQLATIRPKVICALGKVAAQCLLRSEDSVGRMRGHWHAYAGIPLRVTYHPAYLLRNPADKKKCWEDIQAVMQRLAEAGSA